MSESTSAGRRHRRRVGLLVVLALALLIAAGVGYVVVRDPAPGDPGTTPTAAPTPLSELDVSDRRVPRGPFCAALEQDAIEAALGGPVTRTEHYDSGDRARLVTGLTDIAHEYNCGYSAATGAQARAWVFAAPVTRTAALALAREAAGTGCRQLSDAPRFGSPSAASVCRIRTGAATAVTLRGLFGSSWLSCQLSARSAAGTPDLVRRAERWCVQVATTVGSRP
jgi:hypothetical protein